MTTETKDKLLVGTILTILTAPGWSLGAGYLLMEAGAITEQTAAHFFLFGAFLLVCGLLGILFFMPGRK